MTALEVEMVKKEDLNTEILGLCELTTMLHDDEAITADEEYKIDEYVTYNMPDYYTASGCLSSYGWIPGVLKVRREWLKIEIINLKS